VSSRRSVRPLVLKLLVIAAGSAVVVILQATLDVFSYFDPERISPIPSLPLDVAAGAFFGPLLGTLYSALGAPAGSVVSFLIARFLGRELVTRLLRGQVNFCTGCSDKVLSKVVFVSRLIPVVSFDIVSYGAGLTAMSLGKLTLATFLGMLPLTSVYNYLGSVLSVRGWVSALVAGFFVLLFFLIPRLIERYDFLNLRRYFPHLGGKEAEPGSGEDWTRNPAPGRQARQRL